MSFSAANMSCRFVTAVIFISFVSCVLAEPEKPDDTKNATICGKHPEVKASRANLMQCFNTTVARHLNSSFVLKSGECENATDFRKTLDSHFKTMKKHCNVTVNTTDFAKLVDFSLRNTSFKDFYDDISCVKNLEVNISNTCVKANVGFFNVTEERKNPKWHRKATLHYTSDTCTMSSTVKNCVEVILNKCRSDSRKYVASLFEYSRKLGNCKHLEEMAAKIPSPAGNGKAVASWLTIPVIITISIGAVVVLVAIIIIIVLKCK